MHLFVLSDDSSFFFQRLFNLYYPFTLDREFVLYGLIEEATFQLTEVPINVEVPISMDENLEKVDLRDRRKISHVIKQARRIDTYLSRGISWGTR